MTMLTQLSGGRKFRYGTMDVETKNDMKTVTCVGWFDGNKYYVFRTMEKFMLFFLRRKYKSWKCFAHWGSGFDFNFVMNAMEDSLLSGYDIKIIDNGGIAHLIIRKGRLKWELVDSFKLLPSSLEKLTKSFSVEHQKLDVDRTDMDSLSWEELVRYNEYDCKGLYEVLKKFESWFDGLNVPFKTTIASQAMATYRRTMPVGIPNLKPEIEEFIRSGYYGGRVEVFKMRCHDKIYMFDVNSLYPFVMKNHEMPVGRPSHVTTFDNESIGFYSADVHVPSNLYIPVLPFFHDRKLLFPAGNFSGVYTSAELKKAVEIGCSFTVKEGYTFSSAYIFNDYVDKFYKMKKEGDAVTQSISKLLLNALYGKFAQRREKINIIKSSNHKEILGCIPYNVEHGLWSRPSVSTSNFIIPSISSWITSLARLELFDWLQKSGEENIFYCDTDSICTTKKLPTGECLGELKQEMEGEEAIFLSPKMYAIRTEDKIIVKAKGFEKEFTKKLHMKAFDNALHGNTSDFVQNVKRFGKFKESLKRENNYVAVLDKKKSIRSPYSKRIVMQNFDTKPIVIA